MLYEKEYFSLKNLVSFDLQNKISEIRRKTMTTINPYELERMLFELQELKKNNQNNYDIHHLMNTINQAIRFEKNAYNLSNENKPEMIMDFIKYRQKSRRHKIIIFTIFLFLLISLIVWLILK